MALSTILKSTFLKKMSMATLGATVIVLGSASISQAASLVTRGAWNAFNFGEVGKPADLTFEFEIAQGNVGIFDITDAFLIGDVFEIFNFGKSIGKTSFVTPNPYVYESNIENALASGLFSKGSFKLGAGTYSMSIVPIVSPFTSPGVAFARLKEEKEVSVPEPSSGLTVLAFGALGASSVLKRKQQQKA